MAEEHEVEQTTEQESPTVEQEQPEVDSTDAGENLEQTPVEDTEGTPEDKNWRAMREKLAQLERENQELKGEQPKKAMEEPKIESAKTSPAVNPLLSSQDAMSLQFNEMQALNKFPELDPESDSYDELFDITVAGEYRAELDRYAKGMYSGQRVPLPSAAKIAKKVKTKWDARFKATQKEIAEKKAKAVERKQATTEAEGRSDKRVPRQDLDNLKSRSRRGDYSAIAERLAGSKL